MTKNLTLTSILVLVIGVCFSQNGKADSLRNEITNATSDTSRVMGLAELSDYYKFNRPDSSIIYGNKAILLAREINFPKGELIAYQALVLSYNKLGNISKAFQLILQAIKIAERHNLKQELSYKLFLMGNTYSLLGNYRIALDYYRQSKIIADSMRDVSWSIMSEGSMGVSYLNLNMIDSATYYIESTNKSADVLNIDWLTANQLTKLGYLEKKKGNHNKALNCYKLALSFDGSSSVKAELLFHMAIVHQQLNRLDSALFFASESLAVARENGLMSSIINSSVLIAELYESSDLQRANQYNKMAILYKDSVIKLGNAMTIESFMDFDSHERQLLIDNAKKEYQNKIRQYAMLAGLFTFLLIAFILYRNNKQKHNANQVLKATLSNLKSTQAQLIQSEKMASLGELTAGIAHEIQNPLNFVNNFSEINKELLEEVKSQKSKVKIEELDDLLDDIFQNNEKINYHGKRADAIVKGMLQHSQKGSGVKEPTDINALADEYLRLVYHGLRAKDKSFNATIKTDFDPSIGNINIIPQDIGRVLLNLINNAFYAVDEKKKQLGDGYEPEVTVSTRRINESKNRSISQLANSITISVRDNGPGIPQKLIDKIFQPFFTTKPTGEGTGLGLSLSYDIVKAHDGEIKVESKEGAGTEFIIQIPIH